MENKNNNQNYTDILREATDGQLDNYNSLHALRLLQAKGGLTKSDIGLSLEAKLEAEYLKGTVITSERSKYIFFTTTAYELSNYGRAELEREERKITSVYGEVTQHPENLDAILLRHELKPEEYMMKKMILVEGLFDSAEYGALRRPPTKEQRRETYQPVRSSIAERRSSEQSSHRNADTYDAPIVADYSSHSSCSSHSSHSCSSGHSCSSSCSGGSSCGGGCGGGD